jgi:hypothetical protein
MTFGCFIGIGQRITDARAKLRGDDDRLRAEATTTRVPM